MTADFIAFAARFSIKASEAHVLPALFEGAARKAGMTVRGMLAEATYRNNPLGEYLAECARKVASECPR